MVWEVREGEGKTVRGGGRYIVRDEMGRGEGEGGI